MTNGSYAYDENIIVYRVFESLCCTPETKVTFCINYTQMKGGKGWCLDIWLDYQMNGSPLN